MPKTYAAILKGDRVEWLGDSPPDVSAPVKVRITILTDDAAGDLADGLPAKGAADGEGVAGALADGESATSVLADIARRGGGAHAPSDAGPRRAARKGRMLEALDALAEQGAFAEIEDAGERQRARRKERELAGGEAQIALPAVIAPHADELARLCAEYSVLRLEVFGSAASGAYRPGHSDLDFLVEFRALSPGAYADAYFGLLAALERLFGCSVDLVVAKAIKNPYLLESVNQTRTLVYEA